MPTMLGRHPLWVILQTEGRTDMHLVLTTTALPEVVVVISGVQLTIA